jgi:hypothetical protein
MGGTAGSKEDTDSPWGKGERGCKERVPSLTSRWGEAATLLEKLAILSQACLLPGADSAALGKAALKACRKGGTLKPAGACELARFKQMKALGEVLSAPDNEDHYWINGFQFLVFMAAFFSPP